MMRIGVMGHGFNSWGGGVDFLRMVISSLQHAPEPVEIHLLLPTRGPLLFARNSLRRIYRGASALFGRAFPPAHRVDMRHLADLMQAVGQSVRVHEIDHGHRALKRAVRRLGIDALIPVMTPLPDDFPVPWVGYIYDFQHRYFPEFFSPEEGLRRDAEFAHMLMKARCVIVNARAVAADVKRFHPDAGARVFALPFSAAPSTAWLATTDNPAARYGVRNPYFIVCNQFWKHKDHATLFAAFIRIAASCPAFDLVCTGATEDYRDPAYFPSLIKTLADAGMTGRVHVLGMIPKTEQIALLKGARALVQPTLFEGGPGGGAVFDALALGVPCIVSDIEVNRELDEPGVSFFRARDVDSLAQVLTAVANDPPAVCVDESVLLERGRARRRRCGQVLMEAVHEARALVSR